LQDRQAARSARVQVQAGRDDDQGEAQMTPEIIDVQQGTPEWFAARAGIPTASEFSTVMSEGRADGTMPNAMIDALVKEGVTASALAAAVKAAKSKNSNPAAMRAKYLDKLAAEIITGEPDPDSYSNAH